MNFMNNAFRNIAGASSFLVAMLAGCSNNQKGVEHYAGPLNISNPLFAIDPELDQRLYTGARERKPISQDDILKAASKYGASESEARVFIEARYNWYANDLGIYNALDKGRKLSGREAQQLTSDSWLLMQAHVRLIKNPTEREMIRDSYIGIIDRVASNQGQFK